MSDIHESLVDYYNEFKERRGWSPDLGGRAPYFGPINPYECYVFQIKGGVHVKVGSIFILPYMLTPERIAAIKEALAEL